MHELCNKLTFLPEKVKIGETEKTVAKFNDTKEYVIHLRNLKQALNHGLTFKKVQSFIRFNQEAWFKTMICTQNQKKKYIKKYIWERFFRVDE